MSDPLPTLAYLGVIIYGVLSFILFLKGTLDAPFPELWKVVRVYKLPFLPAYYLGVLANHILLIRIGGNRDV